MGEWTVSVDVASPFTRERRTVLAYSALGAYAFWLYAFGPAVTLLRTDLHFSYMVIGGYSAAWAAGSAGASAAFPHLAGWAGRRRLLWSSAAATTAGAALFTLTGSVGSTLAGAVIMGVAGTLIQITTQSILADTHGPRRDRALVESNIGAAACAVFAPLALGGLDATPATWRTAMVLPALAFIGLYLVYRQVRLPNAPVAPASGRAPGTGRLSWACRLLCLLVAVGIGVEFSLIYFAAELLHSTAGFATAQAAGAMTVFYVGILIGRIGGAWLARRPGRTQPLLWASLAITLAGLLVFWLSSAPAPALAGLFAAGVGIANQFPLSLALTMASARGNTDLANARAQLLGAILLLIAPLLLGTLADHVGLVPAFAVPVGLTAASCLLLYFGTHLGNPTSSTQKASTNDR